MGRKDFGKKETKKPKKEAKKPAVESILPLEQPVEVEVIGKRKKKREEEEET